MRAFALLLILANICFFFWAHYIDVPEAAPLPASVPESKRPPRLLLTKEQPLDAANVASSATSSLASELTCISVGPFNAANELEQINKRLQDAGFTTAARSESGEVFAGYWVSLPGLATRADAEQALKKLHAGGVTDAYILPEADAANGSAIVLSLGLFSEQARAEQRLNAIARLGFQPLLQARTRSGEVHWLDVTLQEPGQLLEPSLLQPDSGGIVRLETRACPAANAEPNSSQFAAKAVK
jgi:SPOR domain